MCLLSLGMPTSSSYLSLSEFLLVLSHLHLFLQWFPAADSDWRHHWRRPEADRGERVSHQAVGGTDNSQISRPARPLICTAPWRLPREPSLFMLLDSGWHHRYQWHLQRPGRDGPWAGRHDRWASLPVNVAINKMKHTLDNDRNVSWVISPMLTASHLYMGK